MKRISIYTLLLAVALISIQACGPSEEERRAAEEARLDSLRQVEQERIAEQMEQARQDSIAKAEEMRRQEEEAKPQFAEDGNYVVQVGAFRSEALAESYLENWSDREYPHAYVVKYGNEETGNVWFRLRVGFFDSEEEAAELGKELAKEINTGYWVSEVQRSS
ncbi:SPOR domain-containing protein [Gracilimonas mengyeensis]|uniref:Sporulation related domain-containing protein n=1 Tax=Gracilimonas mengyeensis TaxID=1302730 RepID=A0A521EG86_9BACT|nr:SPOR domain-containing protein [Gracilimonas mengyeensis]SMO82923.1 Sporulation related domain-containing protein [Gracilimonas mengyeensis]